MESKSLIYFTLTGAGGWREMRAKFMYNWQASGSQRPLITANRKYAMSKLTAQLLANFPYNHYADPRSIQRGQAYYKDDRVWDIEASETQAICEVNGDTSDYTVTIEINKKTGQLAFDCDCPYAYDGNFCKHMVAASVAIEVSGTFGSHQEEAQRLGRILRPKSDGAMAHFYTIVSRETVDQTFAANRQRFLTEQGYKYEILYENEVL